jgi:prophage tail gpP-like protein
VGAPIPTFKLEQGEKAFEALDKALKQREMLACPDGLGGLVLLKIGALEHSLAIKQGENLLSASADYDMTDRYSDYLVQAQNKGSDTAWGESVCAVHAEMKDGAVKRYRPLIVRAESAVDAAGARQRAAWECSVRAARSVTVSATVQGFRQGPHGETSAPLWQVNAMTDVDIPFLRIRQKLVAGKVTFKRDISSGSTTVLELKDPAAYKPEPKKLKTGDAAAANFTVQAGEKNVFEMQAAEAAARQTEIKKGKP